MAFEAVLRSDGCVPALVGLHGQPGGQWVLAASC